MSTCSSIPLLVLSLLSFISFLMTSSKASFTRTGTYPWIQLGGCAWEFIRRQITSKFANSTLHWSCQAESITSDGKLKHDPANSTSDTDTHLFKVGSVSEGVDVFPATVRDPSDASYHEPQVSVQKCHHPLSVQIPHDQAERDTGQDFGTGSRGRQRNMSHCMQDAMAQGLLWNFNQAMPFTAPYDQPIFLGNNFDGRHDYGLAMQERMHHPIVFHDEMVGVSCTCTRVSSRMILLSSSRLWSKKSLITCSKRIGNSLNKDRFQRESLHYHHNEKWLKNWVISNSQKRHIETFFQTCIEILQGGLFHRYSGYVGKFETTSQQNRPPIFWSTFNLYSRHYCLKQVL